jgi:ABC-type antimicrobial peptide transport system ATPase subunit
MTKNEFIKATEHSSLLLLECGDAAVYDRSENILYTSKDIYNHALMNPLADFRTMMGHHLLWSKQREVSCGSGELLEALSERPRTQCAVTDQWTVWEIGN